MSDASRIACALLLPLLGALGVSLLGRRPNLRDGLTFVVGLLTFGFVASLVEPVRGGLSPELLVATVLPGLELRFEVEPLGMVFAGVASGLWIVTGLYGVGYMRGHHEEHQTRFFACFAIAIAAALGIAFAANLFTLFLFYEVLTLSTYPLVTHHQTPQARAAGRVYLGVLLFTSVGLLLFAILWTFQLAGTADFRPGGILRDRATPGVATVLLALFVFGTGKAALMPFHRWLPAAMVAPTPVSALLHAVAVVKAGVFTVLKIAIYVFGIDFLRETGISVWLMYVASITILVASLVAIRSDNLKRRLAYSTVSQLAYIVLAGALATSEAAVGGGMHIAMHAMGKITLFFCAGAIQVAAHKTLVSELDGLGRAMPFTMGAFAVGSLSIIGLPPFGGLWSKWFIALGAARGENYLFIGVLMLSSLLSIAYLGPIVLRAFFRPRPPEAGESREAPALCLVPLCATAVGCAVLFFYAEPLYALLAPIAGVRSG